MTASSKQPSSERDGTTRKFVGSTETTESEGTTTAIPLCWTNHSRIFEWDPDPKALYTCRLAEGLDKMSLGECKQECIRHYHSNNENGCNAIVYGHERSHCNVLHCKKPLVPTEERPGWNGYSWDPDVPWKGNHIYSTTIWQSKPTVFVVCVCQRTMRNLRGFRSARSTANCKYC